MKKQTKSQQKKLEKLEAERAIQQGLIRVPPDKCGLYWNTFVFRPLDNAFSRWCGDITALAGRVVYPIYVRKEHAHLLRVNESGPAALIAAKKAGLLDSVLEK